MIVPLVLLSVVSAPLYDDSGSGSSSDSVQSHYTPNQAELSVNVDCSEMLRINPNTKHALFLYTVNKYSDPIYYFCYKTLTNTQCNCILKDAFDMISRSISLVDCNVDDYVDYYNLLDWLSDDLFYVEDVFQ